MNQIRNIEKLNQIELEKGLFDKASWHDQFKNSCYIYIGSLPFDLNEGDLLLLFSQYGEIIDLELIRDKETGISKGFGFIGFEDQRSSVLSVDNLNGIDILGRLIRVDHCEYKGRVRDKSQTQEEFDLMEEGRADNVLPARLKPGYVEEIDTEDGEHGYSKIDTDDPMSKFLSKKKSHSGKKKLKSRKEKKEKRADRKKSLS